MATVSLALLLSLAFGQLASNRIPPAELIDRYTDLQVGLLLSETYYCPMPGYYAAQNRFKRRVERVRAALVARYGQAVDTEVAARVSEVFQVTDFTVSCRASATIHDTRDTERRWDAGLRPIEVTLELRQR